MELTADVTANEKQRPGGSKIKTNGKASDESESPIADDLALILSSLQTMRDGHIPARLPVERTGLKGKIADTFNDIISANKRIAGELKRVGQAVGKEGRTPERTRFQHSRGSRGEMEVSLDTLVEDLLRPTTEMTRAIRRGTGESGTDRAAGCGGRPLEGEFLSSATI